MNEQPGGRSTVLGCAREATPAPDSAANPFIPRRLRPVDGHRHGLRRAACPVTARKVTTMANDFYRRRQQSLEILIDHLIDDEELRDSFLRTPRQTLRLAADWGLPISDSEMQALIAADPAVWDQIADELDSRLQLAA
jgi:hypothetical protein